MLFLSRQLVPMQLVMSWPDHSVAGLHVGRCMHFVHVSAHNHHCCSATTLEKNVPGVVQSTKGSCTCHIKLDHQHINKYHSSHSACGLASCCCSPSAALAASLCASSSWSVGGSQSSGTACCSIVASLAGALPPVFRLLLLRGALLGVRSCPAGLHDRIKVP